MVKQLAGPGSSVSLMKGQAYKVMPQQGDIEAMGYYETKQSIINRLDRGKAKSVSKLTEMKKAGMVSPTLQDTDALKMRRKVIPFRNFNSPFLNFSSGRASKEAYRQQATDPIQGSKIVKVNTGFGRI
jgi:hypothetical protein